MNDHRQTRSPRLLPCGSHRRRRLGTGLMLLALAAALNARAAPLPSEHGDSSTAPQVVLGDRPVPAQFDAAAALSGPASQCLSPARSDALSNRPQAVARAGQPPHNRFGLALACGLLAAALLRGFSIG